MTPTIAGLDAVPALGTDTVFDLPQRPEHLAILGAGPAGVELAQAFRRLGSAVTLIATGQAPLAAFDPEGARLVMEALARDGVRVLADTAIARIAPSSIGLALHLRDAAPLEVTHLLLATDRRPLTEGLGLSEGGIAHGPEGVEVGRDLRTTNRRVYAIGEAVGACQFSQLADHHASLVARALLFRQPVRASDGAVPWAIFTDPELAQVGASEASAGRPVRILRWSFHESDRAIAERQAHGFVKLLTTPRGRLLGATIIGPQASELIGLFTLALDQRLAVRDLARLSFPYPALSEASRMAALQGLTSSLTKPIVRRIIAGLRKLG